MADNPFEIPKSMRDAAEQNMKQAHAAYEQLTDFMTKAMAAWMDAMPGNPVTAGFKDVQGRVMELAKENADSAFAFAGKIGGAKTLQDVLMLQAQFAQDRLQAFVTQTQQIFSVLEDTLQKRERGAKDAGIGAAPPEPDAASLKEAQDHAVAMAKNNAESAPALVETIGKPQNFAAPSEDALPADARNSPQGSAQEKAPRPKSAKSKTATSGASPRSKPKAAKKEAAARGAALPKDK